MEVITEFTPLFFVIFIILGIICAGIASVIILKKIQDYKKRQLCKKYSMLGLVEKFEFTFYDILKRLDEIEKYAPSESWKRDSDINAIRGRINHQLGHIPRFRSLLK